MSTSSAAGPDSDLEHFRQEPASDSEQQQQLHIDDIVADTNVLGMHLSHPSRLITQLFCSLLHQKNHRTRQLV
jgi:hypothetical protein